MQGSAYPLPAFLHYLLRRSIVVPWLIRRGRDLAQALGKGRKFVERNRMAGLPISWELDCAPAECEVILDMRDTGLLQALARMQALQEMGQSQGRLVGPGGEPGFPMAPAQAQGSTAGSSESVMGARACLLRAGVEGVEVRCRDPLPNIEWERGLRQRSLNSAIVLSQVLPLPERRRACIGVERVA
jgi:hypothetical protein